MYAEENSWRKYDEYPFMGAREEFPARYADDEPKQSSEDE